MAWPEHLARLVRVGGGARDEVLAEDARLSALGKAKALSKLTSLLLPSIAKAYLKDLECRTRMRLARLALRLAAQDLPREPPSDLLEDPWDGQPLRYRLLAPGKARLWSCGCDGVDDGGKAPLRGGSVPETGTDLVLELAPHGRS